jgi:hypothetical protein
MSFEAPVDKAANQSLKKVLLHLTFTRNRVKGEPPIAKHLDKPAYSKPKGPAASVA